MVAGQAGCEPAQVLDEPILLPLDADQGLQWQRIVGGRMEGAAGRIVAEKPRAAEFRRNGAGRPQPLEGLGDAGENGVQLMGHCRDA